MSSTAKMNWMEAPTKQGFAVYELWEMHKKIMSVEFNQFSQTAKIFCLKTHRVFKIEKEGFLRNKTVFKNEYGVKIGDLSHETWFGNEGIIHLHDDKFYYTTNSKASLKLVIYTKQPKALLVECSITSNHLDVCYNFQKYTDADKYSTLIMGISWFLFLPVAKEQSAAMAGL